MTRDRTLSNHLELTQAFLAQMLGVRRVGVTVAASNLQRHGLITYARGRIVILDADGLAAVACGCYHAINSIRHDAARSSAGNEIA
jgi:Mn-dependent DtxR family transcriptional regulator